MSPETPSSRTLLHRIADALERLAPAPRTPVTPEGADAFVWDAERHALHPVEHVNRLDLELLTGIDRQADQLYTNTERFARGLPANNALLWGARGMGKSSLVKSVHARVVDAGAARGFPRPALVEIHREDIGTLPHLLSGLGRSARPVLVFCDDLSFESGDTRYKALKTVLEGGIEGRPANVIIYATSNRRHLLPPERDTDSSAVGPGDAREERVSLSDRFGLWLGFHPCDQATFLAMVDRYAAWYRLPIDAATLHAEAKAWARTRGAHNGRVAWQFTQDLAGRLEQPLG